jgi:hypothetical protein
VDVLADLILGDAVALLDFAFELVTVAADPVEIVISQRTPRPVPDVPREIRARATCAILCPAGTFACLNR